MKPCAKRLRDFGARADVAALPEIERLRLAAAELGLQSVRCPLCHGPGCTTCAYEGVVFTIREEN